MEEILPFTCHIAPIVLQSGITKRNLWTHTALSREKKTEREKILDPGLFSMLEASQNIVSPVYVEMYTSICGYMLSGQRGFGRQV